MRKLRSPVRWFGGKGNMSAQILPLFPRHHIYVEPFGGGASLLFAKEPATVEVYNDLDNGLVNLFRVLRDKDQFAEFHKKVSLTPYAREEFNFCRKTWDQCDDPIERAYRFFIVARMSFSGAFGQSWSSAVTSSHNGMSATTSKYLSCIEGLPDLSARLLQVQIEKSDWRVILERYDTPETFFYLDPPYVSDTRRAGGYAHEMTAEDHAELVERLLRLQGKALLSGYPSEVYAPLVSAGWDHHEIKTSCYATAKTRATGILGKGAATEKQGRIEALWANYPIQRANGAPIEQAMFAF